MQNKITNSLEIEEQIDQIELDREERGKENEEECAKESITPLFKKYIENLCESIETFEKFPIKQLEDTSGSKMYIYLLFIFLEWNMNSVQKKHARWILVKNNKK